MVTPNPEQSVHTFRPRARLLSLLGDQLIRDASIAVFELVKNAYDADGSNVTVTIADVTEPEAAAISIEDDGSGMDMNTILTAWLEPGTDFRRGDDGQARTPKYGRLPLGEKGVGRFAVDKLGSKMTMVTRRRNAPEIVISIDWDELATEHYLDEAHVVVTERPPELFTGRRTGTRIEVAGLRQTWERRSVRDLRRSMNAICSPFMGPDNFDAVLVLEPDPGWLAGLLEVGEIMETALFHAMGTISGKQVEFDYEFRPLPGMDRVHGRKVQRHLDLQHPTEAVPLDINEFRIGDVRFELRIFDREPQILALGVSDKAGLREFLNQNGGVRVYRDGIRVYDYGEAGNDWLSLDARRVNLPSQRMSNNLVIGAVSLDRESSGDLVEKTNREGFVEDDAYEEFRLAVQFAIQQVAVERNADKERIRRAYAKRQHRPFVDVIEGLRDRLEKSGLLDEFGPQLDSAEREFTEMRDQLLTAAGTGLSLSMVMHEVDKAVAELNRALDREAPIERIRSLAHHLADVVTGLSHLARRSGNRNESASSLVQHALFNIEYRLEHHGIELTNAFHADNDFSVRCVRRLVIATIMNIVDNSIWWLGVGAPKRKRLWIGPSHDLEGPAIVIADNGPGFIDPPEVLTQPFMSRKTEGMGLGLHLAAEVMKAQGGRLSFPEKGEVQIPRMMTGAVVALCFKGD